jgi:hypothetical protein
MEQNIYQIIIKIGLEDDRLETEVRFATSGINLIDGQGVLQGSDSPMSLAKSSDLLHSYRSTAAIMTSSLAGGVVRKRPACTSIIGVTHLVSRRRCCRCQSKLSSEGKRPE